MPDIRIDIKRRYDPETEAKLIAAVHKAQTSALKTPEHDRNIRLCLHEPHRFVTPPGTGDQYTLIEVAMFSGRTLETKKRFYQEIVRELGELGIPKLEIQTILKEIPKENWGLRGGIPASEMDLGFKVEV